MADPNAARPSQVPGRGSYKFVGLPKSETNWSKPKDEYKPKEKREGFV